MDTLTHKAMTRAELEKIIVDAQPQLYRLCYWKLHQREDAEDACAETVVKALASPRPPDGRAKPETWLFRIAERACIDIMRKKKRQFFDFGFEGPHYGADPYPKVDDAIALINSCYELLMSAIVRL